MATRVNAAQINKTHQIKKKNIQNYLDKTVCDTSLVKYYYC